MSNQNRTFDLYYFLVSIAILGHSVNVYRSDVGIQSEVNYILYIFCIFATIYLLSSSCSILYIFRELFQNVREEEELLQSAEEEITAAVSPFPLEEEITAVAVDLEGTASLVRKSYLDLKSLDVYENYSDPLILAAQENKPVDETPTCNCCCS